MLEIVMNEKKNCPKILVIGVGGGGNNAVERMLETGLKGVEFAAVNTDAQVLESSNAQEIIQIGKRLTGGYGAGADPCIGEAAANENADEIERAVEGKDLVIITAGMGGGTGTGAAPVIARICKEKEILTLGVVTTPFSFEGIPRLNAAKSGVEKLRELVDTLLIIPNDKLLTLSDKPIEVDNAFEMADSVLKYTIEGITNIIFNKGAVNLDFNDLKTILKNGGVGHLGIGVISNDEPIMEAVKKAIESPLLDTSVAGASNLLVNASGKMNLIALSEAVTYVKDIAGKNVNVIWGNVKDNNYEEDKIVVTVIATGMPETGRERRKLPEDIIANRIPPVRRDNIASFESGFCRPSVATNIPSITKVKAPVKSTVEKMEFQIPAFLQNRKEG